MIRIEAKQDGNGNLYDLRAYADQDTIAQLPKSAKFNTSRQLQINFQTNGVNGGVNETGIKRIKSILKAADKLGIGVVFDQPAYVRDELNSRMPFERSAGALYYVTRTKLESMI